MNRWFWALPVLLIAAGLTSANYVLIIINLGEATDAVADGGTKSPAGGGGAGAGKGGGAGAGGQPGGQVGRPGGQVGQVGGQVGQLGGQLGQLGNRGAAGGQVGQVGQVGGQVGNRGGVLGGAGGKAPPPQEIFDRDSAPLHIVTVVELTQPPSPALVKYFEAGLASLPVKHKWGGSSLVGKSQIHTATLVKIRTDKFNLKNVARRFEDRFNPAKPENKPGGNEKFTDEQLFEVAEWTLSHGLVGTGVPPIKTADNKSVAPGKEDKYALVMDQFALMFPTHPAVDPYLKVKAALAKPPQKSEVPAALKSKLGPSFRIAESPHYFLLHDDVDAADVRARLDRLEETMRAFYYWFALKKANPIPDLPREKLVAVLTKNEREFERLYEQFQAGQLVAGIGAVAGEPAKPSGPLAMLSSGRPFRPMVVSDGFYARRDNVVVFSSKRLDELYDALEKQSLPYWQSGFDRKELLKGLKNKGIPPKTVPVTQEQTDIAQSLALVFRAMEQDSELSSTSHDASRQLLYASNLLPRNVLIPEWVEFGMGSVFETSPGSPWPTIASVNHEYMTPFKFMKKNRKLGKTAQETLRTVITDSYFRGVPAIAKDREKKSALGKARSTAWSLAYFLAQKDLDGLFRYFKELRAMPRDLELSDEALVACFARAFGCVDETRKIDAKKLESLANKWFSYIETTDVDGDMQGVQVLINAKLHETLGKPKEDMATKPQVRPGAGAAAERGGVDN